MANSVKSKLKKFYGMPVEVCSYVCLLGDSEVYDNADLQPPPVLAAYPA